MGIDLIRGGRIANRGARKTKSSNSYLKGLIRVPVVLVSSIPSFPAEPMPSSTKSSTRGSTSHDSIDTPSPSPESPSTSPTTGTPNPKITSSDASSQLLAPSPTTSDSSMSPKDSRSSHSSSPRPPGTESRPLREPATPSTNLPSWPPPARVSSC